MTYPNIKPTQCKVGRVNCKTKFTLLLVFFFITAFSSRSVAQDKEAYVVVSTDSTTLTFYYDDKRSAREGVEGWTHGIDDKNEYSNYPAWIKTEMYYGKLISFSFNNNYTTVIFNSSFKDARPTSCAYWFRSCSKITKIEGISNLNTDNVKDMAGMFQYCSGLVKLDLSNFNTNNVENMWSMFERCYNLHTIFVGDKWTTASVQQSGYMFFGCNFLCGGQCSEYKKNKVNDAQYAKIDEGEQSPGYFTKIGETECSNMNEEAYVVISKDGKTITFYYDNQRIVRAQTEGWTHGLEDGIAFEGSETDSDYPTWLNICWSGWDWTFEENPYEIAIFDKSFKEVRPKSCALWFYNCNKMTNIKGIENLITDDVMSMHCMFCGCSNLTTLDLSKLNTVNVTDMSLMFNGCSSLTTLDVRNFNTENVSEMYSMFDGCSSLTTLDVSNFNTANVTNMDFMFNYCSSLTTIDVSKFNTANVTNMRGMFSYCDKLTTILVSEDDWNTDKVSSNPSDYDWYQGPFESSPNLIGNSGTEYSSDHIGSDYAHIDGVEGKPGYLTKDSYKVFYDLDGDGKIDDLSTVDWENNATPPTSFILDGTPELPIPNPISKKGQKFRGWKGTPITGIEDNKPQKDISIKKGAVGNRIYTAVWDDKEAYVVVSADSTTLTFYYDDQRSNRTGAGVHGIDEDYHGYPKWINYDNNAPWIENPYQTVIFDASFKDTRPSSCYSWFSNCTKLTSIEGIENLNTENVTNMNCMFNNCSSLITLDVSKFKTGNVKNMGMMFDGCSGLTTLDVSNFNTENVTNMNGMFGDCSGLTTLDVSNFNTENVTDMSVMFSGCSSLTTLDVSNFTTENVTDMDGMFAGCGSLTTLDVSNFNTENVTDMSFMFVGCSGLTTLDVSNFKTENVTDMRGMFRYCSSLTTIIVSDQWKTTNVKNKVEDFSDDSYQGPFESSPNLIGNAGTTYSDDHQDVDYAHIDTESNPGYLTTESYKVFYDLDGGTWADGANPPTSFALDLKNNIQIPSPKKSGMKFVGWTGTLASGISSETPTMDVQITPDKLGNRIYTAHWVPKTDVKSGIPEKITYPDNPQDNEGFCNGTQKYFTIKFSLPDDKIATGYELAIPKIVAKSDALTGVADDDMIDYEITVDIPDDKQPGAYSGTLTLSFGENTETKEYSLTLEVAAARNVLLHLYKDVIFVNNHDGLYGENGTYQWYRNNQEIPKANYQYIYDPNMSGKYKARMLTTDGVTVYSCPIDEGDGLSKDLKLQVKTYPNPVVAGNEFTLEIEEYDPSAAYTIHISNSNGVVVKEIANATEYTSVTLPRGIYSCVLVSGSRKRGFKIIVK